MDINDAVSTIEKFLDSYKSDTWSPEEIRVRPSGDNMNAIKIWFDFGDNGGDLDALKDAAIKALGEAHKDVTDAFELEVRAE